MAEPGNLTIRSTSEVEASKREGVLDTWEEDIVSHKTKIKYGEAVSKIEGDKGNFSIALANGDLILAKDVILGIGMQGNPRTLGVPGDNAAFVQYQLDDPDAYNEETIVVVGAGDAAIENAIALAAHNKVYIVNRKDEFARAKEGNLKLILDAIDSKTIECYYGTTPARIEDSATDEYSGIFILDTPGGEAQVPVNRIIGRLGAIAPRALVESFGIEFPNKEPDAIPALSSQYESNVKGLYVIGALGGYPLIKQAMNQGYEVVEYILWNKVKPADHDLIAAKFSSLSFDLEVDETLSLMRERIPIFADVNALQFRELILDSDVHTLKKGEVIFERNDYTNSFYTIFEGSVDIDIGENILINSGVGNFFGEMSLISGRRRSGTVYAGESCVVIETPRRTMSKLICSVESVKKVLDQTFIVLNSQQKFAPDLPMA